MHGGSLAWHSDCGFFGVMETKSNSFRSRARCFHVIPAPITVL